MLAARIARCRRFGNDEALDGDGDEGDARDAPIEVGLHQERERAEDHALQGDGADHGRDAAAAEGDEV
jgi:hypothetical protein